MWSLSGNMCLTKGNECWETVWAVLKEEGSECNYTLTGQGPLPDRAPSLTAQVRGSGQVSRLPVSTMSLDHQPGS